MPIKREYKCQIIFQTAANVTQIAKKKNNPKKKETKNKANKSYSNKSIPNCGPQDCMEKSEKEEWTFLAEYALYWKKRNLLF